MILGGAETHEVKEVFLVFQSHREIVVLEDCAKVIMRNQVAPPIVSLAFTLESESIQLLRLNLVPFEQLKNTSKQILGVSWVLIESTTQTI
jgi:hypothetical protein